MYKIYGLVDSRTSQLRYVGFTRKKLQERLASHLRPSQIKPKTHKNHWLRQLTKLGIKPEIILVEKTSKTKWQEDEKWNIAYWKYIGCDLTNDSRCLGGENPPINHNPKNFKKCILGKRKGVKHTEETIVKLKKYHADYSKSKKHKENIIIHNKNMAKDLQGVSNRVKRRWGKKTITNDIALRIIEDYWLKKISLLKISKLYKMNYSSAYRVAKNIRKLNKLLGE